jgi:hypothetical protein
MTEKPMDKPERVTDKNVYWKEKTEAKMTGLPINRNLSRKLFGQVENLIDKPI